MNNNNKQQSLADGSITAGYLASRPVSGSGPDGSIKRGEEACMEACEAKMGGGRVHCRIVCLCLRHRHSDRVAVFTLYSCPPPRLRQRSVTRSSSVEQRDRSTKITLPTLYLRRRLLYGIPGAPAESSPPSYLARWRPSSLRTCLSRRAPHHLTPRRLPRRTSTGFRSTPRAKRTLHATGTPHADAESAPVCPLSGLRPPQPLQYSRPLLLGAHARMCVRTRHQCHWGTCVCHTSSGPRSP